MAICTKCGASFDYAEPHVCAGRDYRKVWAVVAAVVAALLGYRFGLAIGRSGIAAACSAPNAGNLCGLIPSFFVPAYEVIGAGLGAFAGALLAIVIAGRVAARHRNP